MTMTTTTTTGRHTLHSLTTTPGHWVAADPDGRLWLFPAAPGGWASRVPYAGHEAALAPAEAYEATGTGWPGEAERARALAYLAAGNLWERTRAARERKAVLTAASEATRDREYAAGVRWHEATAAHDARCLEYRREFDAATKGETEMEDWFLGVGQYYLTDAEKPEGLKALDGIFGW